MIPGFLLFAAGAVMMLYKATHSRRGLVIEDLIHLDAGEARIFYFVVAGISALFAAAAMATMVRLHGGKVHVEIDDDGITVPGPALRPRSRRFAWAEITLARLSTVQRQVFVTIVGPAGKASVSKGLLTDAEFDEIVAIIAARVPPGRAAIPRAQLR
jgi:hypothetical protein